MSLNLSQILAEENLSLAGNLMFKLHGHEVFLLRENRQLSIILLGIYHTSQIFSIRMWPVRENCYF